MIKPINLTVAGKSGVAKKSKLLKNIGSYGQQETKIHR